MSDLKIDSFKSQIKLNYHNKNFISATNQILNIHNFSAPLIRTIHKSKTHAFISPFDLFSKKSRPMNQFKIGECRDSELTNKISTIGCNKSDSNNPMQDFVQSLSMLSNHKALGTELKIKPKGNPASPISAEILEVIQENKEFVTLRIKRPSNWECKPGQYLEIRSDTSPSAKPAILAIAGYNDTYIEITGKPNSNPSHPNFCLNGMTGDQLLMRGPLGSYFPLDRITQDTPVLVLGGGSGLTALKSTMENLPQDTKVKLVYSTKNSQNFFYQESLKKWKNQGHVISLTQDKRPDYAEGRITDHLDKIELKPNTIVFLCGPPALVLETTKWLAERGISRENIFGSLPATAEEGGPVYCGDHPKMMIT